ncbi:MAG: DUF92 domain-containing protein [Balneolaceae bacterium]
MATIAFIFNWLTIDGAISAGILGSFAYGLGGMTGAAVLLAFFISGSLLSKDLISLDDLLEKKFRRNSLQVWSNGFWFSFWILIWFQSGVEAFLIASVSSVGFAASDTWATEIGEKRLKGKTRLITTGKKVSPGTDGGVSFYGTVAAVAGAIFISLAYWLFEMESSLSTIMVIAISGFLGCLIDSYIGARFQNNKYNIPGISWMDREYLYVSNNFVNWISSGIASLISLIIILIFSV